MKEHDPLYISSLLARFVTGKITDTELETLESWLESDPVHREMFQKITGPERLRENLRKYDSYEPAAVLKSLHERVAHTDAGVKRTSPRKLALRLYAAAAVVMLVLAVGWRLYFPIAGQAEPEIAYNFYPDGKTAILETSDGRRINLDADQELTLLTDQAMIRNDSGGLTYTGTEQAGAPVRIDKITIPTGGEYFLTLSDGTKVWLNAETEFSYPARFGDGERVVHLSGEAYFEVAKGSSGFVVHAGDVSVSVLGTSFNIKAYRDEDHVATTLTAGSVGVRTASGDRTVKLDPGQQAIAFAGDQNIQVFQVDPQDYTGWKDNLLVFNNESLEQIARKLSRWYGVEVTVASPEIRGMKVYGVMQKYESIGRLLEMLKQTCPIHYETGPDHILIKSK